MVTLIQRLSILTIVALLGLAASFVSAESAKPQGFHIFLGVGNNYVFPGSIRLGYEQWELGKLSQSMYGVASNFYFTDHSYTSLGLGVMGAGARITPALSASIGTGAKLLWGLGIRIEILAQVGFSGVLTEQGALGLTYDF